MNCSRASCKSSTISSAISTGGGRLRGVFQAVVLEPEDIQVHLVAFEQVLVVECVEMLALLAFVPVLGVETLDEAIEISRRNGLVRKVKCWFVRRS